MTQAIYYNNVLQLAIKQGISVRYERQWAEMMLFLCTSAEMMLSKVFLIFSISIN